MAAGGSAVGRFQKPEYINFLKTSQALRCVGEGLVEFCTDTITNFHRSLNHGVCPHPNTTKTIEKLNGQWTIDCSCGVCDPWLRSIEQAARHNVKLYWTNTDAREWPTHPWQLAKVYMGQGKDPASNVPADTDTAGLLQLINNCKEFNIPKLNRVKVTSVRELRNAVMHSSNYEFSATELATNLQALRDVLQEPVLHSYHSATTAIAAINDIGTAVIDITDPAVIAQERDMWKEMIADQTSNTMDMLSVIQTDTDLKKRLQIDVLTIMQSNEKLKQQLEEQTRSNQLLQDRLQLHGEQLTELVNTSRAATSDKSVLKDDPEEAICRDNTDVSGMLSDRFLNGVANMIGHEYFELGLALKVQTQFIKRQENNFPRNTRRVTAEILLHWRDQAAKGREPATMVDQLCAALRNIDLHDVADDVERSIQNEHNP